MAVKYEVDLTLFRAGAHSPSFFSLVRSITGPQRDLLDFCVPCNPYFPTPALFARYAAALEGLLKYYPSDNETIGRRLADTLGLDAATIVLGNGSTELITWIDALLLRSSLATPVPTFGRWTDQPAETGKRVSHYRLRAEDGFRLDADDFARFVHQQGAKAVVVCNPNNPDGGYLRRAEVLRLLDRLAGLELVVIDESFIDFVEAEESPSVGPWVVGRDNVIVLKSLGKNFGLHGVRFGYTLSHPRLAARLRRAVPRWNLNALAEAVIFSLRDHLDDYRDSLRRLWQDRRAMGERLRRLEGVTVYPSQANFFLVRLPDGVSGTACRDHLLTEHGVFVRECGNKIGSDSRFLRLVVRRREEVDRLIAGLADFLGQRPT
jgi:histidinol-phosphate/aromatic aminotransferase/cobyric acid decarboxylase-like protein